MGFELNPTERVAILERRYRALRSARGGANAERAQRAKSLKKTMDYLALASADLKASVQ